MAISRIKNESDIVECFVRHTGALVDAHIILDNGSTDGTGEILRGLADEGAPIELMHDPTIGGDESATLTGLMRRAAADYDPDWVLPLDVDEFIGIDGRRSLEDVLQRSEVPVLLGWRTYAPLPVDDPAESNPVLRIRHRLDREYRVWEKVLVPKAWTGEGRLTPGHHDISLEGRDGAARTRPAHIPLCHFPIRSLSQYTVKLVMGNLWYEMLGSERNGLGFHYEGPFRRLLEDWDAFRAEYHQAGARFAVEAGADFEPVLVEDPFRYLGAELRLTPPPRRNEPWQTILEYTRQLAQQIGRLRTERR